MAVTEEQAKTLANILREAKDSADQSHNDLVKWLSDELQDCKPEGSWCCFSDFIGDGESGTVYFYCNGDLSAAPYTISQSDGTINVEIDMGSCEDVLMVTTYKTESDETNAGGGEGEATEAAIYTAEGMPLYERDIPQSSRKKMDAGSFAGKGRSFPIAKPEDVKAALQSIGRAGPGNHPPEKLRANIKRIAKKKGFPLPKSLKDEDKQEATREAEAARAQEAGARHSASDRDLIQTIHDHAAKLGADCTPDENDNGVEEAAAVEITGDVINLREGAVGQDGTVLLKVIQPGWGSSGYYSSEVLERDLPKVYPAGTKNFWDHQTAAEEAARPEGSLRDLASVTTEPVKYMKDGPDGPGGYVRAKAFEAFKQPIDDLAKYIGMSIRASGKAKEGKAPDGKTGPIIEQLTAGHSIDYVTTPGAGGKVMQLFEAARGHIREASTATQHQQEQSMAEDQKLTEALAEIKKLKERAAVSDAAGAVGEYFRSIRAPQAIMERVTARVLAGNIPLTESGDLDRKKIKEFTEAQYNEELEFLKRLNPSLVTGMNSTTQMSESDRKKQAKAEEKLVKESSRKFASVMGFGEGKEHKIARKILREGRSAFDPHYNARTHGAEMTGEFGSLGMEA